MKTSCCQSQKIQKQKDQNICMNTDCKNYMNSFNSLLSRNWGHAVFIFFFTLFITLSFNDFSSGSKILFSSGYKKIAQSNSVRTLNKENLRLVLEENNILCPDQVYAQIMIESGNLESYLAQRTNNLLGMRFPAKRSTSAIGIYLPSVNLIINGNQKELKKYTRYNNYAVYENWEDCIKDYKYWQQKSFNLSEVYLKFLGNCYAEDSLYVDKIKSISNN